MQDRRILDVLVCLAKNAEQPQFAREAAMYAMAGYIDSRLVAYVRDSDGEESDGAVSVSFRSHTEPSYGDERPNTGDRRRIIPVWTSLESDPDRVLADGATYLLKVVAPRFGR